MGKFAFFLFLILLFTLAYATPRQVNYQGKLTDSSGVAIDDADRTIGFLLYDVASGGTAVWAETLSVEVSQGLFDVVLGIEHPINMDFSDEYWIQIEVDGNDDGDINDTEDETLSPRVKFSSVPYAIRAIYADSSGGGGGDNWGSQNVISDATLAGNGDETVLSLAQQGAGIGDYLTWNGSSWSPVTATDENYYVTGAAFNTSTGVLTLYRSGLTAVTVDLDDRYVETTSMAAWSDASGYIYPNNATGLHIEDDGDIDLNGRDIERVDELSANSIDPVMKIKGQLFRTWTLDMLGQRVEVVGQDELGESGEICIDLANQPEASDLWLFFNCVESSSIIPFVTPHKPAALYARVDGDILTVGSEDQRCGIPFSYRLIGIRKDFRDMTPEETNRRKKPTDVYIDIDSGAKYRDSQ